MADRVQTVAKSEIQRLSSLTFRALKSGAYLYPLQVLLPSPLWPWTKKADRDTRE